MNPPLLVGRDAEILAFGDALDAGPGVGDGPSKMADVATRLGSDVNYASQYRLRLIAADMIRPSGRGRVDFRLPYLRDYLRENPATIGM